MEHPWIPNRMSKVWRASFEFEMKPQSTSQYQNLYSGSNYYPPSQYQNLHSGSNYYPQSFPSGHHTTARPSNNAASNNIESIFHFGDNQQQVSINLVILYYQEMKTRPD